ncbi:hypothetical protein [Salibacter halophilus]|uniref:Lipoprotein n=1 Tax=Salibacter halophilus TaxID=1803916 RepID=A0A6N6M632_9FLAO|nr:hypothetical protein [Salibacter halophilus]KAB1065173.1 hypothetical protein F3059_04260 [Salibacter halophilus]
MKFIILNISLFFLIGTVGCNTTEETTQKEPSCNGEEYTLKDFTGLDGCKFLLVDAEGNKYEPVNLKKFMSDPKDKTKVRVKFRKVLTGSICMVGSTVEIICIEETSPSN